MFGMCGIFAEFEREMIVERVRAGVAGPKRTAPAAVDQSVGVSSQDRLREGVTRRQPGVCVCLEGISANISIAVIDRSNATDRGFHFEYVSQPADRTPPQGLSGYSL